MPCALSIPITRLCRLADTVHTSASATWPSHRRKQTSSKAYQTGIHKEQSDLISLNAQAFIATATDLLGSERFTTLGMALMALTGRRPGRDLL
jgi:hypothetical protein